jgi:hypothetical protein
VFWFVGGTDPQIYAKAKAANKINELPVNHSPKFATRYSSAPMTSIWSLISFMGELPGTAPLTREQAERPAKPHHSKGFRGGTPRRVCCLDLPFLFFFCAFSIGAFGAFFEAISALS